MFKVLVVLLFLLGLTSAQQPNRPEASLVLGGNDGPPWPIVDVPVFTGTSMRLTLTGAAGASFTLLTAAHVEVPGEKSVGSDLLDLDLGSWRALWDPTCESVPELDESGLLDRFELLPNLIGGTRGAVQGLILDATAEGGARLTAASGFEVLLVEYHYFHQVAPAGSVLLDLTPLGLSVPFYGVEYSKIFVNAEGSISFLEPSSDLTPTLAEVVSGPPRLLYFWSDLSPASDCWAQGNLFLGIQWNLQGATIHGEWCALCQPTPGAPACHFPAWSLDTSGTMGFSHFYPRTIASPTLLGITAGRDGVADMTQANLLSAMAPNTLSRPAGLPIFEYFHPAGASPPAHPWSPYAYASEYHAGWTFTPNPSPGEIPGSQGYSLSTTVFPWFP